MTRASRARLILPAGLVALVTVFAVAGASAVSADAGHPLPRQAVERPAATMKARNVTNKTERVRHVVLQWKGAHRAKKNHKSVGIPGIGRLTMTCRANETQISLRAGNHDRETQMWMAKYQDKSYGPSVAVKTVRIYKYANANDPGHGGTSNPQHEGLNLGGGKNGVENYEKGYAYGLISQRASRNQPITGSNVPPATSFNVNWYWNGFDYPPRYRYCKIDAVFITKLHKNLHVDWHGESDAAGQQFQQSYLPGLGYLQLRCETGRDGNSLVSLVPDNRSDRAYIETIQGEGRVDDQVSTRNAVVDDDTGKIGPVVIPRNGMMRFFFYHGGSTTPYILSSYQVTNNPNPRLDLCEIAMTQLAR